MQRGLCHDLLLKKFCPTVPKRFVGEPFSASIIWGIRNFCAQKEYVTSFCRKLFCSLYRKTSYRIPLCFRDFLVSKKIMGGKKERRRQEISQFFVAKLLSHSVDRLCRGNFLCLRKIPVSKRYTNKRGRFITNFCPNCFVSHY